MLSVPIPSEVSGAKIESNIYSTGSWTVSAVILFYDVRTFNSYTHLSFVRQSQIPSHARIIK